MRRLFWILFVLAIVARILFATEFASKELGLERYPLREMRHFTMAAKRITEGDLVMRGSQG